MLVYVGAVMVLFLFVVMMLDINIDKLRAGFWGTSRWPPTIGVADRAGDGGRAVGGFRRRCDAAVCRRAAANIGNTKELGKLIYTQYIYRASRSPP